MAYIPKKVSDRLLKEIGKFQRVLARAKDRDLNEADTVNIVSGILSDCMGFDKYTETTREIAIRNSYCDIAVKVNDDIKFLIEVKAVGLDLKENHLRQATNYAANHGVRWAILTNGVDWEIYEILLKDRVTADLVGQFDFLDLNPRKTEDKEKLFLLCKEGLSKAAIEEFHEHKQAVNRFSIGAVILEGQIVDAIRRELRKASPGLKVDNKEIEAILRNEVLKRDVIEREKAHEAVSRYKKLSKKHQREKEKSKASELSSSSTGNPSTTAGATKIS